MTDELISRAEQSLEGVTEGPWEVAEEIDGWRAGRPTVIRARNPNPGWEYLRVVTVGQTRPHFGTMRGTKGQDEANVAFIAAARSLVPELLEALKEARNEVQYLRGYIAGQDGGGPDDESLWSMWPVRKDVERPHS
ncbi:hypothetical protein PBI_LUCKY2013_154 [Mycobacterium phage Lucky2013]|uniref:hypothetical protein n=1 Tax=Mycobacterium phage MiaZeal TaxID=1567005 RepID=UPI000540DFEF|nr:hypothetical protein AVV70_gp161 [Mycobacterium phage MiaZeal]AIY32515.1 hypothetical protein PBI_MIAZEAL_161 [Mycobacterium phage MiaZeal]ASD50776.1 hypothetical protein PORCELAIN_158 [Mycobacterium phage Porcelain]ASD53547.1 hypothetical protein PBI_LUCKY2013_154 [Mycobacterium phage Lucky2013]